METQSLNQNLVNNFEVPACLIDLGVFGIALGFWY